MSQRKTPCANCHEGERLPAADVTWEVGGEGTGGVVSTPGWVGAISRAGEMLAWTCTQCQRQYVNPAVTALRAAMRRPSWRSRTRRFV